MTTIHIQFDNNYEITFKLLENEFVEEWFANFKFNNKTGILYTNRNRINQSAFRKSSEQFALQEIDNIVATFKSRFNIVLPFNLYPIDRQKLNLLHRCFTTMKKTNNTYDITIPNIFRIAKSDILEYDNLLDKLNEAVHDAEQVYYVNDVRTLNYDFTYGLLKFEKSELIKIKSKHFEYLDLMPHSVLLNSNILGKSYFNCYLDYDNPCNHDIKNEEQYCNDLEFEFNKVGIFDMLKDNNFIKWLVDNNIQPSSLTCGRMPIGDIVDYNFEVGKPSNLKIKSISYA